MYPTRIALACLSRTCCINAGTTARGMQQVGLLFVLSPALCWLYPEGEARARAFAQKLGMGLAIVDKRRQKANSSEVMNIIGDVRDKHVILLDDMVDTGGSLCHAAEALVTIGGARDVVAAASHGVLSGPAVERIEKSCIKELFFLNTIPASEAAKQCSKIKFVNVADVFAEAISRIFNETSVSPLFQ